MFAITDEKTKVAFEMMKIGTTLHDISRELKIGVKQASELVRDIGAYYEVKKRSRYPHPTLIKTDGVWKTQRDPIKGIAAHDPFRLADRPRAVR
jgi:hypothetical protein